MTEKAMTTTNPEAKANQEEVDELTLKYYIGCKLVQARPMNRGAYNIYRGWKTPPDENPADFGYLVVYPNNYETWSPKAVFESAYLNLDSENNTITQEMITSFVAATNSETLGNKTTVVQVTLINGWVITESSSCVDPANYNKNLGTQICIDKINTKIWELLGFLLQTAIGGLKAVKVVEVPESEDKPNG